MNWRILTGDVVDMLRTLPDESVQCCVTSPPYWGLRDYGVAGQIGLEATPQEFVARMVAVFAEVRRVLRSDGVAWVNIGDSYNGQNARAPSIQPDGGLSYRSGGFAVRVPGLKPKDLVGIPWRLAFALQADGWWLRSECIWHKSNPMPESVTDRPTKAHEQVFLFTKAERYAYDADAVRLAYAASTLPQLGASYGGQATKDYAASGVQDPSDVKRRVAESLERNGGANLRTVWTIPTQPYAGAHFATFPEVLAERCILSGSAAGTTVLDPFCGSGTTGAVALAHGRSFIGIDLNPEYVKLARKRIIDSRPLFAAAEEVRYSETPVT